MEQSEFKVGMWVTALFTCADQFTKGKDYKVRDLDSFRIFVEYDDRGELNGWGKLQFEPSKRNIWNEQIKQIVSDDTEEKA